MAEQERIREKMQTIEEEDKLRTAEQEAAAMSQRHQEEREETERKLKREKEKAAVIKRQQEESAARKRSVEDLKREIERLENLKGFNAAKAKLQVYEEDYFLVKQERITPNPANIQWSLLQELQQSDDMQHMLKTTSHMSARRKTKTRDKERTT
ncbi:uncharacterized protein LOC129357372 [Poeciliopsis prolifica]|uniref:uncharacterized protein LOC129357372 n=1 Tax=Poeciliopsis prolifica TaxID=188132 RepID=UPI002414244A|nr:uncharacterized protein LOC129357372 [Poeciliopsis prolifica]